MYIQIVGIFIRSPYCSETSFAHVQVEIPCISEDITTLEAEKENDIYHDQQ